MPVTGPARRDRIGVGAVGVRPEEQDGILADLPGGGPFELVCFCDEGLDGPRAEYRPTRYCSDFNMLLDDPAVELVLVDGATARRRDFAVRALNAGRHVVLRPPFGEEAADAERIMRTALRHNLVATMDVTWRDEPDLAAMQAALAAAGSPEVWGLMGFWSASDFEDGRGDSDSLLAAAGLAVLDQLNVLVRQDIGAVNAHLSPDGSFMVYLSLRGGGWATARLAAVSCAALPRFVASAGGTSITVRDGEASVQRADGASTYKPGLPTDFWTNLRDAIRSGADVKCHPVDIVRAMKLHEAALAAVEAGRAVTV